MQIDALSPDEARRLFDYARRKFKEERFPFSPELRPVREAIGKLEPTPTPRPAPQPYVPSSVMQTKRRR